MNSQLAVKLYGMLRLGIIKSHAQFFKNFTKEKLENFDIDTIPFENELKSKNITVICIFDDEFPKFNFKLRKSETPFLFLCKGNIDLINQISKNIAIVGVISPTEDIKLREQNLVKKLVFNNLNIVSGLARGCDSIAHKVCLENEGKTIAILPTTFENLYPKENLKLANEIISSNGLVLTEYVNEPKNKFELIKRFIERDRLQAMLSSSIILIASYSQGNGDSGSRHAMYKAKEYGKTRFVMFNKNTDFNNPIFALNKEQIDDGVIILTEKSIREILK